MLQRKRKLKRLLQEPAVVIGLLAIVAVAGLFFMIKLMGRNESSMLQTIRSRGMLRVGVYQDRIPFGYLDEKGTLTGFEVDLGELLAEQMLGKGFAEYKAVQQKTKEAYLNYGYVDVLLAMAETGSSAYLSTTAYYADPVVFLAADAFAIENSERIVIAVVLSSSSEKILKAYLSKEGLDRVRVRSYPSVPDAIDALQNGKVMAVCYQESILRQMKEDAMRIYDLQIGRIEYGIAVPKGDERLLSAVQDAFEKLKESGKLNALYRKYRLVPQ